MSEEEIVLIFLAEEFIRGMGDAFPETLKPFKLKRRTMRLPPTTPKKPSFSIQILQKFLPPQYLQKFLPPLFFLIPPLLAHNSYFRQSKSVYFSLIRADRPWPPT